MAQFPASVPYSGAQYVGPNANNPPSPPPNTPYSYPAPNNASNQDAPILFDVVPTAAGVCTPSVENVQEVSAPAKVRVMGWLTLSYGSGSATSQTAPLAIPATFTAPGQQLTLAASKTYDDDGNGIALGAVSWSPASCAGYLSATPGGTSVQGSGETGTEVVPITIAERSAPSGSAVGCTGAMSDQYGEPAVAFAVSVAANSAQYAMNDGTIDSTGAFTSSGCLLREFAQVASGQQPSCLSAPTTLAAPAGGHVRPAMCNIHGCPSPMPTLTPNPCVSAGTCPTPSPTPAPTPTPAPGTMTCATTNNGNGTWTIVCKGGGVISVWFIGGTNPSFPSGVLPAANRGNPSDWTTAVSSCPLGNLCVLGLSYGISGSFAHCKWDCAPEPPTNCRGSDCGGFSQGPGIQLTLNVEDVDMGQYVQQGLQLTPGQPPVSAGWYHYPYAPGGQSYDLSPTWCATHPGPSPSALTANAAAWGLPASAPNYSDAFCFDTSGLNIPGVTYPSLTLNGAGEGKTNLPLI